MQVRHNITFDKNVSGELGVIASELGEKKNYIIEKALTVYFDILDLKLAKKRLKDLEEGKSRLVDSEEVRNRVCDA